VAVTAVGIHDGGIDGDGDALARLRHDPDLGDMQPLIERLLATGRKLEQEDIPVEKVIATLPSAGPDVKMNPNPSRNLLK